MIKILSNIQLYSNGMEKQFRFMGYIEDVLDNEDLIFGIYPQVHIRNYTTLPDWVIDTEEFIKNGSCKYSFDSFKIVIRHVDIEDKECVRQFYSYPTSPQGYKDLQSENSMLKRINYLTGMNLRSFNRWGKELVLFLE